jgi:hypothetical protein
MHETRVCAWPTSRGSENLYHWDSVAEQSGFEPPVPACSSESGHFLSVPFFSISSGQHRRRKRNWQRTPDFDEKPAGPAVRIHFAPINESLQTDSERRVATNNSRRALPRSAAPGIRATSATSRLVFSPRVMVRSEERSCSPQSSEVVVLEAAFLSNSIVPDIPIASPHSGSPTEGSDHR